MGLWEFVVREIREKVSVERVFEVRFFFLGSDVLFRFLRLLVFLMGVVFRLVVYYV